MIFKTSYKTKRKVRLANIIFLITLFSAGFIYSLFMLFDTLTFINRNTKTKATVIQTPKYTNDKGDTLYYIKFKYLDSQGNTFISTSKHGLIKPLGNINETVSIYYNNSNPIEAKPNNFTSLYFNQIVMLICSGILLSFGLYAFFRFKKHSPNNGKH